MKTLQQFLYDCYLSEERNTRPLSPETYTRVRDKADSLESWAKGASQIMFNSRNRQEVSRLNDLVNTLKARAKKLRSAAYHNQPAP